jgi:hypothetical protein
MAPIFVTEESAALFQAATDEHWGADCSKLMNAILVYNFDRHSQIARSTAFRMDLFLLHQHEWWSTEKTGNVRTALRSTTEKIEQLNRTCELLPPLALKFQVQSFATVSVWRRTISTCSHGKTFRDSLSMRASVM